jgi:hypothetical protein
MKLKYIMYNDKSFILLPLSQSHDSVKTPENKKIISAGFVNITELINSNLILVNVSGESASLNIKSNYSDKLIIFKILNNRS